MTRERERETRVCTPQHERDKRATLSPQLCVAHTFALCVSHSRFFILLLLFMLTCTITMKTTNVNV